MGLSYGFLMHGMSCVWFMWNSVCAIISHKAVWHQFKCKWKKFSNSMLLTVLPCRHYNVLLNNDTTRTPYIEFVNSPTRHLKLELSVWDLVTSSIWFYWHPYILTTTHYFMCTLYTHRWKCVVWNTYGRFFKAIF